MWQLTDAVPLNQSLVTKVSDRPTSLHFPEVTSLSLFQGHDTKASAANRWTGVAFSLFAGPRKPILANPIFPKPGWLLGGISSADRYLQ
jgi:hypothetical protein